MMKLGRRLNNVIKINNLIFNTGFSVLMPKLLLQCGKVLKRIGGKDESFVFNKFLLKSLSAN